MDISNIYSYSHCSIHSSFIQTISIQKNSNIYENIKSNGEYFFSRFWKLAEHGKFLSIFAGARGNKDFYTRKNKYCFISNIAFSPCIAHLPHFGTWMDVESKVVILEGGKPAVEWSHESHLIEGGVGAQGQEGVVLMKGAIWIWGLKVLSLLQGKISTIWKSYYLWS